MKSKIISILILALAAITANAQDDFNPTLPGEPNAQYKVTVSISNPEAGSVSRGGSYSSGRTVTISKSDASFNASANVYYKFKYWTLNGVQYSTASSFTYTVGTENANFVAVYEAMSPDEVSSRVYIQMSPADACYSYTTSGQRYREGNSVYISCSANAGFEFQGWYENEVLISSNKYFYYTVGKDDATLTARFVYNPAIPQDPANDGQTDIDNSDPDRKLITLTIGNDDNAQVDRTRVVFNEEKLLDYESDCDAAKFISENTAYQIYSMDGSNARYSINERPTDNGIVPLGIIVKTAGSVTISTSRLDCEDAILVDKVLKVEHPLATGGYTFTSAAGTFESRFELKVPGDGLVGDVNGDGSIDGFDIVAIIKVIKGKTDGINISAADVNQDNSVDGFDIVAVLKIIKQK